jgi:hypothetical protein
MKHIRLATVFSIAGVAVLVLGLSGCLSGGGGGDSGIAAVGGGGGGGGGGPVCARPAPAAPVASAPAGGRCVADASTDYLVADFYVDQATGNDANNGLTAGTAWATLTKALASAPAGKTVFVRNGNYGVVQELVAPGRASYLTLRAEPGHSPVVTKINIDYPVKAAAFLRFVGFVVKNTDRNPDNAELVTLNDVTDVELLNNTISSDPARGSGYAIASVGPGNPATIDGIGLSRTDRITIKSNCVSGVFRGIQLDNSTVVSIIRNFISPQAGTAIQHLSNNSSVLILDNHIRGMSFTPYCTFVAAPLILANCDPLTTPLDPNAILDPHASIISIRSNDVTIRNNIMHGMGSTSGIRAYLPDANGGRLDYSDITIEGNLIYDIHHPHAVQITGLADRVLIRNNTVVSKYDVGVCAAGYPAGYPGLNDARSRYSTAFGVESIAPGKDGSGLTLANNILVGATYLGGALAVDKNNIFWSYAPTGSVFSAASLSGTSTVVTSAFLGCNNHSTFFETGFFAAVPNFTPSHGLLLNYDLAPASVAVAFGDTASQLDRKLGTLDVNNFFINDAGDRCTGEHNAGAY